MNIRPLCPELQQKAIVELNEDPTRVEEHINSIKEWAKKQPNFKIRTDDQWLLSFLRGCKFSHEKTKHKLKLFYETRTSVPEFFSNRNPMDPVVQEILSLGIVLPLKTFGSDSQYYILVRSGHFDYQKISTADVFKVWFMISDILINENDNSIVVGTNWLEDFSEIVMGHFLHTPLMVLKRSFDCMQHAYPMRIKGLHYFNVPTFFDHIYNICKHFLTQKLLDRVFVYGKENKLLFNTIPKEILPIEYGGTGETIAEITDIWKKKVESYKQWFEEDVQYKSYGALESDKTFSCNDVFGIDGSFKTINVD